jgi:hypothetical protein
MFFLPGWFQLERCPAERLEPATHEERILVVAYTNLLASILRTVKAPGAAELRSKVIGCIHDAFRQACPNHRTLSPEELFVQVRCLAELIYGAAVDIL